MVNDNRPSKTQRKKTVHALQGLGEELVELPAERLATIELPERLRDAVMEARSITAHEARRRQMQYIGKIMRKVDAEPIRAALEVWRAKSDAHTAGHKRVEIWRDRLLADADAVGALVAEYPAANVPKLRALMDGALRERAANQPPRAFRQLYQALRELIGPRVTNKGDD
jgi:ribosome-associated protein